MILFLPPSFKPTSPPLEQFLFSFRERHTSELILNGCDIALIPFTGGFENRIVPRDTGCLKALMSWWHLDVAPHYPYTDVAITPHGITGITDTAIGFTRFRLSHGVILSIDVHTGSYAGFLKEMESHGLIPYFVGQEPTGVFTFTEPSPTTKHIPLTLTMNYHPEEYLEKSFSLF